jgi:hypothetical protein
MPVAVKTAAENKMKLATKNAWYAVFFSPLPDSARLVECSRILWDYFCVRSLYSLLDPEG